MDSVLGAAIEMQVGHHATVQVIVGREWGMEGGTVASAPLSEQLCDPLPVQEILRSFRASTGLDIQMRVGVHIGDVTHGVVGSESPRFCA